MKCPKQNKNIDVKIDIQEDNTVYADPDMLNTIIRNLLSNTIKYTHEGWIRITGNESKDGTIFPVEDNGIGIDKKNQKKLFNITQHISTKGTNQEEGTGLGLLLCKEFVEKHNGTIWIESEPGKGSKFHVFFPKN